MSNLQLLVRVRLAKNIAALPHDPLNAALRTYVRVTYTYKLDDAAEHGTMRTERTQTVDGPLPHWDDFMAFRCPQESLTGGVTTSLKINLIAVYPGGEDPGDGKGAEELIGKCKYDFARHLLSKPEGGLIVMQRNAKHHTYRERTLDESVQLAGKKAVGAHMEIEWSTVGGPFFSAQSALAAEEAKCVSLGEELSAAREAIESSEAELVTLNAEHSAELKEMHSMLEASEHELEAAHEAASHEHSETAAAEAVAATELAAVNAELAAARDANTASTASFAARIATAEAAAEEALARAVRQFDCVFIMIVACFTHMNRKFET